jgi:hypothetical protein
MDESRRDDILRRFQAIFKVSRLPRGDQWVVLPADAEPEGPEINLFPLRQRSPEHGAAATEIYVFEGADAVAADAMASGFTPAARAILADAGGEIIVLVYGDPAADIDTVSLAVHVGGKNIEVLRASEGSLDQVYFVSET